MSHPRLVHCCTWLVLAMLARTGAASASEPPFVAEARGVVAEHGQGLLTLARRTLEEVVDRGIIDPELTIPAAAQTPAPFGLFVTLVRGGVTRGCYGTMDPLGKSLERLVMDAAVGAARFDPRSRPIRQDELRDLQIILSFVGPTVPVLTAAEVDPKRHGLMVRSGERRSVLLPGEAKTASWSLKRNLRQAGIRRAERYEMFRFRTVTLYEDHASSTAKPKRTPDNHGANVVSRPRLAPAHRPRPSSPTSRHHR